MPRKGISKVDVVRAYVALIKQRRLPGPRNLRLEMGTGCYTTIAQHVRALALKHPKLRPMLTSRMQHSLKVLTEVQPSQVRRRRRRPHK